MLAWVVGQWQGVGNTAVKLWVTQNVGNFVSSCATVSFSSMIPFYGVNQLSDNLTNQTFVNVMLEDTYKYDSEPFQSNLKHENAV
jgi:hypothetical protein